MRGAATVWILLGVISAIVAGCAISPVAATGDRGTCTVPWSRVPDRLIWVAQGSRARIPAGTTDIDVRDRQGRRMAQERRRDGVQGWRFTSRYAALGAAPEAWSDRLHVWNVGRGPVRVYYWQEVGAEG